MGGSNAYISVTDTTTALSSYNRIVCNNVRSFERMTEVAEERKSKETEANEGLEPRDGALTSRGPSFALGAHTILLPTRMLTLF
jgi:hypothetical protein